MKLAEKFKIRIPDMKKTGQNITRLRKAQGLSVSELRDLLGLSSNQAIYKWQWGQSLPDIVNLMALSEIFKVDIKDIIVMK